MNKQAIVCCQLTTRQPGWHERIVRQATHLREKSDNNQHIYSSVICPHGNLSHIRHATTDRQTEHFNHKWKQKFPVLIANLYIFKRSPRKYSGIVFTTYNVILDGKLVDLYCAMLASIHLQSFVPQIL